MLACCEPTDDGRSLKIAGFGALLTHFLLFFIVLPDAELAPIRIEERESATVLQRWEPPASPARPSPPRVRGKRVIPVPWPVVEEPLLLIDEATPIDHSAPSAEFWVGPPAAGSGPPGARVDAIRVGVDGLLTPQLLEKTVPEYTARATRAGIRGTVYIEAVITEQGTVIEPVLLRGIGDDELDRRALEAVALWTFKPGIKAGRPVKVIATFTIDYNIH